VVNLIASAEGGGRVRPFPSLPPGRRRIGETLIAPFLRLMQVPATASDQPLICSADRQTSPMRRAHELTEVFREATGLEADFWERDDGWKETACGPNAWIHRRSSDRFWLEAFTMTTRCHTALFLSQRSPQLRRRLYHCRVGETSSRAPPGGSQSSGTRPCAIRVGRSHSANSCVRHVSVQRRRTQSQAAP
jgi:hypothetical protein